VETSGFFSISIPAPTGLVHARTAPRTIMKPETGIFFAHFRRFQVFLFSFDENIS